MDATGKALEQKITWVREAAGALFADLLLGILVTQLFTTEDREQAVHLMATILATGYQVSTDAILRTPYVLIGSIDQICEDLLVRWELFGISYISVFEHSLEVLAPVLARIAVQ